MKTALQAIGLIATLGMANAKVFKSSSVPNTRDVGDVGIVLIPGADQQTTDYDSLAQAIVTDGAGKGINYYVTVPDVWINITAPMIDASVITNGRAELTSEGFDNNLLFVAGHNIGGIAALYAIEDDASLADGVILMGATMNQNIISVSSEDGKSHIDYPLPVLTLGAELDGVNRITRTALAYWHGIFNIEAAQVGQFPVRAFAGLSHSSFASGTPPPFVADADIQPEVPEAQAHALIAESFSDFAVKVFRDSLAFEDTATHDLLKPFIEALELESNYALKPPCYERPTVNSWSVNCTHGSDWNMINSQRIMAGDLPDGITLRNDDNSHLVADTDPIHLPSVTNDCSGQTDCIIKTITVSETHYEPIDVPYIGMQPVSASEIKTKLTSRQVNQEAAGNTDADFHETDEVGDRCKDINDVAIQWAYDKLNDVQKSRYDTYGVQMVNGPDRGPYNAGPLWIWTLMAYTLDLPSNTLTVSSAMMRTPDNYYIKSARGFHYCKILSPARAFEWMTIDSLVYNHGLTSPASDLFLQ